MCACVQIEEHCSSREWSSRPLGLVEIPGTVAECRGRFRMVYWKSTGKSYGRFPAVVRPLFSQNIALFDYRLFLRWGLQRNWLLFGFRFHHSSSLRKPAEKEAREMLS